MGFIFTRSFDFCNFLGQGEKVLFQCICDQSYSMYIFVDSYGGSHVVTEKYILT